MVVVQIGQMVGVNRRVCSGEAGHTKQHLDFVARHVLGQTIPQHEQRRTAPIIGVQTGPAQFQQFATACAQC